MTNITPTSDVWADPVAVPDEGEEITAATGGAGRGPVRPGFLGVLNRAWSILRGKVSFRAIQVSIAAGTAVNPPDGTIVSEGKISSASGGIESGMGDITAQNGNVLAPRGSVRATEFDILAAADRVVMTGPRLLWSALTGVAGGGNPPRNLGLTNDLRPLTLIKGWARVSVTGGAIVDEDGANFLAASLVAARRLRINLAAPMANNKWAATCNAAIVVGGVTTPVPISPIEYGVDYVDLLTDLSVHDLSTETWSISVHWTGRQNS